MFTAKDGEERASHGTVDGRKSARKVKNQKITGMNTPLTSDECVCERVYTGVCEGMQHEKGEGQTERNAKSGDRIMATTR